MDLSKVTPKQLAIAFVSIILIIVTIYLVGRYTMKKKAEKEGKKPIKSEDLPNSGSGVPTGWTPSYMSERLYNALKGISIGWMFEGKKTLYAELNGFTDDQFTLVFKDYTRRYDRNLYDDLADEWVIYGTQEDVLVKLLLRRAERLEL